MTERKTAAERVAADYGISLEEAGELLGMFSEEELLPPRGYGLVAEMVGYSKSELATALLEMESRLSLGERARLQLYTDTMPSHADLADLYLNATAAGFHLNMPSARTIDGVPTTEIVLTKGSPIWPALIALIPTLLIGGLVAFSLVKVETLSKALLPLALVVIGGGIVMIALLRGPAERVGAKYLERVPATRKLPAGRKRTPTRAAVRVEVWEERDRLHIGIQDKETGEYYASWWDDDARQMFEDGFFKPGKQLKESVLEYAESVGILVSDRRLREPQKKAPAVR